MGIEQNGPFKFVPCSGHFFLEKAFDSIKYNVLLHHLYLSRINGKTWRLIKSWHTKPTCTVSINYFSAPFKITQGVKQRSVLSPIIFNLVMDRILSEMNADNYKIVVFNVKVGCAAHADDITLA